MLLRSSRAAEYLDKEAFVQKLQAIGQAARKAGNFISGDRWKWGKRLGGGAILGLATVPMAAEAAKRSRQGMSQESFQLRQQGLMPGGPPQIPKV